jgi:hypothetical protein
MPNQLSATSLALALVVAMCGASIYMWSLKDEASRELVAKHEPWPLAAGVEAPVLLVVRLRPDKQRTKVWGVHWGCTLQQLMTLEHCARLKVVRALRRAG